MVVVNGSVNVVVVNVACLMWWSSTWWWLVDMGGRACWCGVVDAMTVAS